MENFPLRLEPIIERRPMPVALRNVAFIGPFGDQDLRVSGGR